MRPFPYKIQQNLKLGVNITLKLRFCTPAVHGRLVKIRVDSVTVGADPDAHVNIRHAASLEPVLRVDDDAGTVFEAVIMSETYKPPSNLLAKEHDDDDVSKFRLRGVGWDKLYQKRKHTRSSATQP